ncbi:PAS domain-containing protein [Hymenobacter monticola]|uniref:histidine kinase n=1 Tax=Hymenobacter monticola TaxID=1705399 RepID=A0ABY4BAJ8_9BACT|nr:PAS domain-containing protein [Hymenobacter monticola]UOE33685.1 PAS domain-containing protein [Hymenobacter monticola]
MSDFPASALPETAPAPADLLRAVFDVSLSPLNLLRPLYANGGGEIADFGIDYLNPAAQRLTGLAGQPGGTLHTHFPNARANGLFAFYCRVFETNTPDQLALHYLADQQDTVLQVAAQRHGGQLVASFMDAATGPRTAVETALRESRAREQAARAEAEAERNRLQQVLERMSANVALLSGPEHRYSYVNPEYLRLFPGRPVLGRTLREVIPELEGQGFYELFDRVYETGEPYYQAESEAWADYAGTGQPQRRYYRTSFEPLRNAEGRVTEVLNFAVDVTAQVEARQEVERLSREAEAARADAERQRGELLRVFEQAPLAIAVYRGPNYVIELANPTVCRLWGRRQKDILGKGLFEALPEVAGMGYEQLLDEVMATGVPYVAHAMEAQHDRNGRRETVYWDFVYVPMYEPDGRVYGAMVVATEVTTQVHARQQMQQLNDELEMRVTARSAEARAAQFEAEQQREQARHQQALLGQILGQVPAAIATLMGPEHRYTFFNGPYQALSAGRTALGRTVAEVLPEVEEQGFISLLDQVYTTGEPFIGAETLIMMQNEATGQPEQHYLDFIYQPLRDAQQRTQGILVFALDVTDRVRARKQADTLQTAMMAVLRQQAQEREAQRAELRRIFEQAPVAIAILRGPALVIELANDAVAAIWQRPAAEVLGRPYFEALPETTGQGFEQLLREVLRNGRPLRVTEAPVQLPAPVGTEPRQAYVDFVFQPLFDEERRVTGLLAMGTEVTDQVQARQQVQGLNEELYSINEELQVTNEELIDTNNRLIRTNADLDTFVYTASHDLKAPIANIEGLLEALRYDLPPAVLEGDGVARLLDMMQGSVARFQQTIGHLTSISQVQHRESTETVDLPALVRGRAPRPGPAHRSRRGHPHRDHGGLRGRARGPQNPALGGVQPALERHQIPRPRPARPGATARSLPAPAPHPRSAGQRPGPDRRAAGPPLRHVPPPAHPRRRLGRGPVHGEAPSGKRGWHHSGGKPAREGFHLPRDAAGVDRCRTQYKLSSVKHLLGLPRGVGSGLRNLRSVGIRLADFQYQGGGGQAHNFIAIGRGLNHNLHFVGSKVPGAGRRWRLALCLSVIHDERPVAVIMVDVVQRARGKESGWRGGIGC